MSSSSRKKIVTHARSKLIKPLTKSLNLRSILSKLSIKRLTHQPGYSTDHDDVSSIGNPTSSSSNGLGITLTNNSSNTNAQDAEVRNAFVFFFSTGTRRQKNISGLLLLPQEIFDHITSYLGHAQIAVLALVNKELMFRFMSSCIRSGIVEPYEPVSYRVLDRFIQQTGSSKSKVRGTLLSLLDYDMEDVVYCYKCKRLHDPFLMFVDRAYAPHKAVKCADWPMEHHMPPRATRKLLRTISKRRIHGAEYRYLLAQINNTQTVYHKGTLVQISLRARYRHENLILRRQQVVAHIDKSSQTMWLFAQMLKDSPYNNPLFLSLPQVFLMCNHQIWNDIYQPLIRQLVDPLCKGQHTDQGGWKHEMACFSGEHLDVSKQKGHMVHERLQWIASGAQRNPTDVPTLLGDVLGCDKCTTDFSIDVVPLPEPFGWGFVLTSWFDLGRLDFCAKWDSHREARPSREMNRYPTHGDICEMFEDLPSRLDYRAEVSSINKVRMENHTWAQRAKQGKDRYMNWSSGHTCNPATGWIEDPDSLEEEDY
ncbi:uncharacterized protein GGS22DRAFT_192260 [Annulohypoxylon maeteangense]|uniref:uncharacterized protein n=1 Tax=Annulohypoxylon maeteangense TaxID=1927788 RepID=UPI002007A33C|nr:uncharacterized protein GGS22DRAFT_192260 [Annulohypoxylon maeteangense]KAI0881624.1 hypothetical protein GGS22DRAFT_192260 [Annulohypoxylon maeteangense]